MDSILIQMIVLAFAAFALTVGARTIVHDWINPAFLLMKPLSCDFCMSFWTSVFAALVLQPGRDLGEAVITALGAAGLALFLTKKKALMEPPPTEIAWPTSHDS